MLLDLDLIFQGMLLATMGLATMAVVGILISLTKDIMRLHRHGD